jgi:signal transduction histidine kinase
MEVKDGKIDKSLFRNMHISFSQGTGFGALITLLNILVNSAKSEGDHFLIDRIMMDTIKKNMIMAENAINTFSDIEWVISNKLKQEKISCHALHDNIIAVRNELKKFEEINNHRIKISDKKPQFATKFVEINDKYFSRAIKEILLNAMKFSEEGSDIFLLFDILQDQLSISVINNPKKDEEGRRGIPMEFENLIFEPFFRMTKAVYEKYNTFDYGLGLTLVDKIIDKHNGKITGSNITDYTDVSKGPESKVEFNILLKMVS